MAAKINVIVEKAEHFADRIVKMYHYLAEKKTVNNDILRQIIRSGTSVGANVSEGQYAQSKADFLTKMSIALKEANETRFWIERLYKGGLLTEQEYQSILNDNNELISILVKITGTVKKELQK